MNTPLAAASKPVVTESFLPEIMRTIVESCPDCIKVIDGQGRIVYINPGGIEALDMSDRFVVLDKRWLDFWNGEYRKRAEEALSAASRGAVGRFRGPCATFSGTSKWWDVAISKLDTGNTYFLVVSRDVTQEKTFQDALIKSEKLALVGRLASMIAHEINNPLTVVMNLVYLAECSSCFDEAQQHLIKAKRELAYIASISKRTLGFVRNTPNTEWVHLGETVKDVVALYQPKTDNKELKLEWQVFGDPCVEGVSTELKQVVSNLVANAIDASEQNGKLRVRASTIGAQSVCVSVLDEGRGITAEQKCRLFEPFFTTKKDTGTGLGLWVCQEIVQHHNGRMRIFSNTTAGSSGTVVTIVLPKRCRATLNESLA
jgi:PAS domain S-box-containing protein